MMLVKESDTRLGHSSTFNDYTLVGIVNSKKIIRSQDCSILIYRVCQSFHAGAKICRMQTV